MEQMIVEVNGKKYKKVPSNGKYVEGCNGCCFLDHYDDGEPCCAAPTECSGCAIDDFKWIEIK